MALAVLRLKNLLDWKRGPVYTTGWDPEIFAVDGKGKLLPAFKFLPDKKKPFKISRLGLNLESDCANVQHAYWDGFQAEFTTLAQQCHGFAFDEIQRGLQTVLEQARKKDFEAKLTIQNVFEISMDEMFDASPEQLALGCDPSFNAYGKEAFCVANPFELPYRMAGGHIHFGIPARFGYTNPKFVSEAVKYLDLLLALPSVGMFANFDNPVRRRYYGRAGEFRLPPHGIEYRTLSNAWLGHPAVSNVLMDIARNSFGWIQNHLTFKQMGITEAELQSIIDNTDVDAARAFYTKNKKVWDSLLFQLYLSRDADSLFEKMVMEGVESVIPEFGNLERNWKLFGAWENHCDNSKGSFSSLFSRTQNP